MSKRMEPIVRQLASSHKVGVVVSAGKMDRAVKVRIAGQEWNKAFRKLFPSPKTHIVADPNNSLVEGDVVRIASGWRTSKSIRHVVTNIVAPFGAPVEDRPPVLTDKERLEIRIKNRLLKDVRSAENGRRASVERLHRAQKQGYEIPSLAQAMANVRIATKAEKSIREGDKEQAHRGQSGQLSTQKERRVQEGIKTKEERKTEDKVKNKRKQTA